MLLTLVGSLMLIAEVFFPSGGALGFLSAASYIGAIYSAAVAGGWVYGLGFAAGEVILLPILLYVAFNVLPRTPIGRVLIGAAPTASEVLPVDEHDGLVGRVGIARSKMLPAGAVEIDGRMIDALSQGQAIEPGEYVKIVEASRNRVVVRRASTDERPDPTGPAASDALARPAEEIGLSDFEFDAPDDESTSRDT